MVFDFSLLISFNVLNQINFKASGHFSNYLEASFKIFTDLLSASA